MRGIPALAALLWCLLTLAVPESAFAHPLGNFTINRYARLEIQTQQLRVYYVLDMAEIPTYQDMATIHTGAGLPSASERRDYLGAMVTRLGSGISADVDGAPLRFSFEEGSSQVSYPPGQGNLPTTRVTAWFRASMPTVSSTSPSHMTFRDVNFDDRIGWKEVVVRPLAGVRLDESSASSVDQSDELTKYPQDMLSSPLDVRGARVAYSATPGLNVDSPLMVQARGKGGGWLQAATDAFTNLVSQPSLTPRFVLFALLAAAALGGVHALSPGHGKTIVAAYLVGSRGTPLHALILGLTVTITHTAGVFGLGLVTLFASRYILPERLYPWLSVASGVMVAALGAWLFLIRLRSARRPHGPRLAEVPRLASADEGHARIPAAVADLSRNEADLAITIVGGAPSAGATASALAGWGPSSVATAAHQPGHAADLNDSHERRDLADVGLPHEHGSTSNHHYPHAQGIAHLEEHGHVHGPAANHEYPHAHGIAHAEEPGHDHGTGWHTHTVPAPGMVGLRGLIALGVSGGLLPCPSALVVLLAAVSLQRVGFGIVLVLAFSLGLAGVLTGIGLLLVYARGFIARFRLEFGAGRFLPAASALVVLLLGVAITLQALVQAGLAPASGV